MKVEQGYILRAIPIHIFNHPTNTHAHTHSLSLSCNTALARLTDSWLSAINRSDLSGDVFLDFKKAFDLVDQRILLSKLSVYLNSSNSLPFFCSYLKNRIQCVFIRGSYSSEGTVKYGVPQGSVLGPVLFCIYTNDLLLHITSNSAACHMLADDTTLHTTGKTSCKFKRRYSFVLIVFQCGATLITCSLIL